jgi:hypothetical protein
MHYAFIVSLADAVLGELHRNASCKRIPVTSQRLLQSIYASIRLLENVWKEPIIYWLGFGPHEILQYEIDLFQTMQFPTKDAAKCVIGDGLRDAMRNKAIYLKPPLQAVPPPKPLTNSMLASSGHIVAYAGLRSLEAR